MVSSKEGTGYDRWRRLLTDIPLPTAIVDLDAVDANIETLCSALDESSATLRVASKSVRSPWLLNYILKKGGERFRGLMTYSAHEARVLSDLGIGDLLMGYPVSLVGEAEVLASLVFDGVRAIAMVDGDEQVRLLSASAIEHGVEIPVCIDIDASWRPLGGRLHFGVRRSAIRDREAARTLARQIGDTGGVKLVGLLAYEAQIAGIREHNPGSRHLDPLRRVIKVGSRPSVANLRAGILDALRDDGHEIELINGGGTGSIHWTATDPSVTEITAGSGFLCPHLFDGYRGIDLEPAAFFALSVVRSGDDGFITCAGGGYPASGPGGPDRTPIIHLPQGLAPLAMEGFGEVQTPFKLDSTAPELRLGDPVICRHAKGGELGERFGTYLMVRGEQIVGEEPTYRGLGHRFL